MRKFSKALSASLLAIFILWGGSLTARPALLDDYHPFVSGSFGYALIEEDLFYLVRPLPGERIRTPDSSSTRTIKNLTRNYYNAASLSGYALTLAGGIAYADSFRLGAFAIYNGFSDANVSTTDVPDCIVLDAGDGEAECTRDERGGDNVVEGVGEVTVSHFHLLNIGSFVGLQFELGANSVARHYIYFDYGIGVAHQISEIEDRPNQKDSTLVHMVRTGVDVPLEEVVGVQGLGFGIQLQWLQPQDGDMSNSFSLTASTTYHF